MKTWKFIGSPAVLYAVPLAFVVTLLSINHRPYWAAAIIIADAGLRWWGGLRNLRALLADSWIWMVGLAGMVVITLTPNTASQILLGVLYGLGRGWLLTRYHETDQPPMVLAAVVQALVLWAVFLAAAVWHWLTIVILMIVWVTSWIIGLRVLASANDRVASALALTWAMIVAECSWVFSLWLVNYIVFGGVLIIPQPAVVLSALGYCLAGIYLSHRQSQLTRKRLIEYLTIGLVVLVIVIAGTKWNGVI